MTQTPHSITLLRICETTHSDPPFLFLSEFLFFKLMMLMATLLGGGLDDKPAEI